MRTAAAEDRYPPGIGAFQSIERMGNDIAAGKLLAVFGYVVWRGHKRWVNRIDSVYERYIFFKVTGPLVRKNSLSVLQNVFYQRAILCEIEIENKDMGIVVIMRCVCHVTQDLGNFFRRLAVRLCVMEILRNEEVISVLVLKASPDSTKIWALTNSSSMLD